MHHVKNFTYCNQTEKTPACHIIMSDESKHFSQYFINQKDWQYCHVTYYSEQTR